MSNVVPLRDFRTPPRRPLTSEGERIKAFLNALIVERHRAGRRAQPAVAPRLVVSESARLEIGAPA
jgi:hypothetical protein